MRAESAIDIFRTWMSGGTRCDFAARFAHTKRLVGFQVVFSNKITKPDLNSIATTIDADGAAKRLSIILFPRLREPGEVHDLIDVFAASDRWAKEELAWRNHKREGTLISLRWKIPGGLHFSVMGFAPFGCMPVTRRAPYVAIAVWNGKGENDALRPKRRKDEDPNLIGLVDLPHELDPAPYKAAFKNTTDAVAEILDDPPEDIAHLRGVAFCLPKRIAGN